MKNLLLFFLLTTAFLSHAQHSLFVRQNNYAAPEAPSANTINVIVAPTNGGNLVLNLDARNSNSLAQTANPGTWYDLSGNQNNATLYGSLAYGTGNGGALNLPTMRKQEMVSILAEVHLPFKVGCTQSKC